MICPCCGKPKRPENLEGLGTALKPAMELIALARKPLSEPTIAANVLRWGTGALNIEGCRVDGAPRTTHARGNVTGNRDGKSVYGDLKAGLEYPGAVLGRWPANVVHDGSDEVLAAFPDSTTGGRVQHAGDVEVSNWRSNEGRSDPKVRSAYSRDGDSGSAARFFYCAKADNAGRAGSFHPTVKPVDLMRWLVRLVTPPGGVVLDPFAGTGTTGAAAFFEGFHSILIERETEYLADIERRMTACMAGPDERARLAMRHRQEAAQGLPLFAEPAA